MKPQEALGEPASPEDATDLLLQACLDRLAAGDPAATDDLITVAHARLWKRAHQMLQDFPAVQPFNQTGDIVSLTYLRLRQSLDTVHPENPRRFLGLVGLEMRRALIDVYRHCKGPESYEANRATNVFRGSDGELHHHVDGVADAGDDPDQSMFERLHEAADKLDEASQELFHMRWFLGMTHAQIAAQIGCCEKTVKRDWSRVKKHLWQRVTGEAGP